jgi:hypothetical protein
MAQGRNLFKRTRHLRFGSQLASTAVPGYYQPSLQDWALLNLCRPPGVRSFFRFTPGFRPGYRCYAPDRRSGSRSGSLERQVTSAAKAGLSIAATAGLEGLLHPPEPRRHEQKARWLKGSKRRLSVLRNQET